MVIMGTKHYNDRVNDFIANNNIKKLNADSTDNYVQKIIQNLNKCVHLFDERTRRSLKPINSRAPVLTGLPKIHKVGFPIRPLVNFTTAPGYTTAKKLVSVLKQNLNLTNNRSVVNNTDFIFRKGAMSGDDPFSK